MSTRCLICKAQVAKELLVDHLRSENLCRNGYLKQMRVTSFDQLVAKLFVCEACWLTQGQLKRHLMCEEMCFRVYSEKYSADSIEEVLRKHYALKRSTYPSRLKDSRAKETVKRLKNIPLFKSLNDYRSKVSLSNYKLCFVCHSNFSENAARDISDHEKIYLKADLGDVAKKRLRRREKYAICNTCDKKIAEDGTIKTDQTESQSFLAFEEDSLDGCISFVPSMNMPRETVDTPIEETHINIMLPVCCVSAQSSTFNEASNKMELRHLLYQSKNITRKEISLIYQNELFKLKSMINREKRVVGRILDPTRKILGSVINLSSKKFSLSNSSDWYKNQAKQLLHRQEQLGNLFLTFKVDIPEASLEVVATCLMQEGYVISIDTDGTSFGESSIRYIVHLDHRSDEDCSDQCLLRMDLVEFLQIDSFNHALIGNKFAGTYVSSVHQKLVAFTTMIIKAPQNGLYSEDYHVTIKYDEEGHACLVGCIWPDSLSDFNAGLASGSSSEEMMDDLDNFVSCNLFVTSDSEVLSKYGNISFQEASKVIDLVMRHQLHICSELSCQFCITPKPPSLKKIMKEECSFNNLKASKLLNKLAVLSLRSLTRLEKETLSSQEWLDMFLNEFQGEIDDSNMFIVTSSNNEEIRFELDDRIVSYFETFAHPLEAIYHYSISCCNKGDEYIFVFQRLKIIECYINTYNPFILLAANSRIHLDMSRCSGKFELYTSMKSNSSVNQENNISYRRIAIQEAIALLDKTKRMTISSSPIEYVDASQGRLLYFKKTNERQEDTYEEADSGNLFDMLPSYISRHFSRLNGENLLLAETVTFYDYVGKDESTKLFQLYSANLSVIPDSNFESANHQENELSMLPSLILCGNGDVMKIRKSKKILSTPSYKNSYDFQYSRVMLFFPINEEQDITPDNLFEMFTRKDSSGTDTIVRSNER